MAFYLFIYVFCIFEVIFTVIYHLEYVQLVFGAFGWMGVLVVGLKFQFLFIFFMFLTLWGGNLQAL